MTEYELKLTMAADALDALTRSPALAGLAWTERETVATYFDTPAQDLRAAHVSLRIRRAGGRRVQTVKAGGPAAAGLFARPEWEREVAGDLPEIDAGAAIRTLVPAAAPAALAPAFAVLVTRRLWEVERDGARIELVADLGAVVAGDRSTPVAEIELELRDGPPAALFALARDLAAAVPLRLGVLTKAERGYRLCQALETRAEKAGAVALDATMTVADALAAIVASCLRQFRLNEELLAAHANPAALHQARVALRRLRSALSIFAAIVADPRVAGLAGELRRLAQGLGEARDLDVLIARVAPDEAAPLAAPRAAAYAAAAATLADPRTRALGIDLVEWAATGAWREQPQARAPIAPVAAALLDRLYRKVKRRGRDLAAQDDEARHRVRIQAKKLRYATEFFAGLFPDGKRMRRHRRFVRLLARLQDDLGALNDLATAPALRVAHGLPAAALPGERAALIAAAAAAHEALADARRFWR